MRTLREWIAKHTSRNVVYFDETGFKAEAIRLQGWAVRGRKIFGDVRGNNRKVLNLIMAQRGKQWIAPMLFEKSCTHQTVNAWVEQVLLPELHEPSLIVMDNAPFHSKKHIRTLLENKGHTLLPLPTYSPDLNPIEQSFAILKKRRLSSGLSIQQILSNYFWE
ncbi:IS630 family transposase [Aetokthonos hydrillicola Thurmond2011]|uniref:IS630 family transposase n=1 Tax=Aetokthonos hydrillicola Thurmond2011 TaxID=2712845 RepID=A0AAP5ME70_9CYAN|nr:IS630 family transposase [Aetokthonos hydrillicola]MDR9900618.1 IS630 family transposase [Aetokthonos hydrillicola Thurmond2011]